MDFLIGAFLGGLSLLAVSLQRTYSQIPAKELRRRARAGDEPAAALYRAAAYGHSLSFIPWVLVGLTSAGFFVYVARTAPVWFALAATSALIWVGFVWLSASRATDIGKKAATTLAPAFASVLSAIHPLIDALVRQVHSHRPHAEHTGLYEKADLLDLLDRQDEQADNRIERAELEIARSALMFGDKLVGDVMTPRRVVKTVSANDDLGPVLMSELHNSGHSRFPVFNDKEDNVIGTLFLRDLVNAKAGGKVKDKMVPKALYLHEDQPLHDALQAILKTRHHLYVVVNSFEEYVGIITIEDVMEQIIGEQIMDEFDEYEDLRMVAKRMAEKEHVKHVPDKTPHKEIETETTEPAGEDKSELD